MLDVRAGRAVRALAGDRAHYAPLASRLHPAPDPLGLARAYRDTSGFDELYVADLDALAGGPPDLNLVRDLAALGLSVWLDAGLRAGPEATDWIEAGAAVAVAGLETLSGPAALAAALAAVGPERLAFSLDLRGGRLVRNERSDWRADDPRALAEIAIGAGARRLILLDLERVGTGRGVGTGPLLRALSADHPSLELVVGGGIAGRDDLDELARAGASAALVGSALHDGRIGEGFRCGGN